MNYSIIIPHKNVPDLLQRLLDSIPLRNDTEIIIIDDNSDSKKVNHSNFPGIGRKNTKVIFLEESMGAGFARNKGIETAKGKWLLFADADDFYTEKLTNLLDRFKDDDKTEVVYFNAQSYFEKNGSTGPRYFNRYFDRYEKKVFYAEKVLRYNVWTPWTRMVKGSFVKQNKIRYEEIPVGNDKMFCLNCSRYAKRIDVEKNIIYNYYVPEKGSVTFGYTQKKENIILGLELKYRVNQLYSEVGFPFKQSYLYPYIRGKYSPEDKEICMTFMRSNSISLAKDLMYACLSFFAKFCKIL